MMDARQTPTGLSPGVRNPGERKWHVEVERGVAGCGAVLTLGGNAMLTQVKPAGDVPANRRCRRIGCAGLWP